MYIFVKVFDYLKKGSSTIYNTVKCAFYYTVKCTVKSAVYYTVKCTLKWIAQCTVKWAVYCRGGRKSSVPERIGQQLRCFCTF